MNHDAASVARQIGKTENWVRRNAHRLPHSRAGKTYFWTDADIAALFDELRYRPERRVESGDELRPFTGTARRTA